MEKISFQKMIANMQDAIKKKEQTYAVIVFDGTGFKDEYKNCIRARSYCVNETNKFFHPYKTGNSLFGFALDDQADYIDLYRAMCVSGWSVDYCYMSNCDGEAL